MRKLVRERYRNQIKANLHQVTNDLESDQIFALKVTLRIFLDLILGVTFIGIYKSIQIGDWLTLLHIVLGDVFIVCALAIFLLLPGLARYNLLRNWAIVKRELLTYLADRKQRPSSHWLLSEIATTLMMLLTMTFYRKLTQLKTERPPHLNLRRKAPFLLFQQANLLLAP